MGFWLIRARVGPYLYFKSQYSKALNNKIYIEYILRAHKLKAFEKDKSSVFFEM